MWGNRFEYRRNMQEVLPGVFLGPLQVARVNSTLRTNKITMLVPVRTPISLIGEIFAQRAGIRPIPAPEPIPKSAAKSIIGALPVAGSHNARIRIVVKELIMIMTLKRPTLSAITFGTVRPMTLTWSAKIQ